MVGKRYGNNILTYNFDQHLWLWDAKFWLVNNQWCMCTNGEGVVGDLEDFQKEVIDKYQPEIDAVERQQICIMCKKRSCLCKKCNIVLCCNHGCSRCIDNKETVKIRNCRDYESGS